MCLKNQPKQIFTIVTVSFGYNHFLREWALAVKNLNSQPKEIIIGIDEIDSQTKKFVEESLTNLRWIYLKKRNYKHFGPYFNEVIKFVTTDWVCKIDADDLIHQDAYDNLDEIQSDIYAFGCTDSESNDISLASPNLTPLKVLYSNYNLLSSLSPFRKSVWEKNQFKDFYFDDWIFWIDAGREGSTFSSSSISNYTYRNHSEQATKKIDLMLENSILANYRERNLKEYLIEKSQIPLKKILVTHQYPLEVHKYAKTLDLVHKLSENQALELYLTLCNGRYIKYCPTNENMEPEVCQQCVLLQRNATKQLNRNVKFLDFNFYLKNNANLTSYENVSQETENERVNSTLSDIFSKISSEVLICNSNTTPPKNINVIDLIKQEVIVTRNQEIIENSAERIFTLAKESTFFRVEQNDFLFNKINLRTNLDSSFSKVFEEISSGFRSALAEISFLHSSILINIIRTILYRLNGANEIIQNQISSFFKKYRTIYDLGANTGKNLNYYLERASKVVAIEANPLLCHYIRSRFLAFIRTDTLRIMNYIVADKTLEKQIIYIHIEKSELSSSIKPAMESENLFYPVAVDSMSVAELIRNNGHPYYVKIDLEGADYGVLKSLVGAKIFPRYISVEIHNLEVVEYMQNSSMPFKFQIVEPTEYSTDSNRFTANCAGPFGSDLKSSWDKKKNLSRTVEKTGLGWKDLHIRTNILFYLISLIRYRLFRNRL
jgi:FkbM family methyltransferase